MCFRAIEKCAEAEQADRLTKLGRCIDGTAPRAGRGRSRRAEETRHTRTHTHSVDVSKVAEPARFGYRV